MPWRRGNVGGYQPVGAGRMPVGNPPFGDRIGDDDVALDDLNADATHAANIGGCAAESESPAEADARSGPQVTGGKRHVRNRR